MLDKIDIALLQEASKKPEQTLACILKPILTWRKSRTLYDRLNALESQKLLSIDRNSCRGSALATITQEGLDALRITGREDCPSRAEVQSS